MVVIHGRGGVCVCAGNSRGIREGVGESVCVCVCVVCWVVLCVLWDCVVIVVGMR